MTHDMACQRPATPDYDTPTPEKVELMLDGTLLPEDGSEVTLYVWKTHLASRYGETTTEFEQQAPIVVSRSQPRATLTVVEPNDLWTVTTRADGHKGVPPSPGMPSPATLFPTGTYTDDFEDCRYSSEAKYFLDQTGAWECMAAPEGAPHASHGTVMKQMTPVQPIEWYPSLPPHSLIGHRDMTELTVAHDVFFPNATDTAVIGVRWQSNHIFNSWVFNNTGMAFVVMGSGKWFTAESIDWDAPHTHEGILSQPLSDGQWHRIQVSARGQQIVTTVDGKQVLSFEDVGGNNAGSGLIGTLGFGQGTLIDNFELNGQYHTCAAVDADDVHAGSLVSAVQCGTEVGPEAFGMRQWIYDVSGQRRGSSAQDATPAVIRFKSKPDLCMEATQEAEEDTTNPHDKSDDVSLYHVTLMPCDPTKDTQRFTYHFEGVTSDTKEGNSFFRNVATRGVLNFQVGHDIGAPVYLMNAASLTDLLHTYRLFYDVETYELWSDVAATCVGVC